MAGLLSFLGFGKKSKPNLTQAFREIPQATSAPLFGTLEDFSRRRIKGEDGGFGEDFVSLANPAIASRKARFRDETLPEIGSQLSSRGVARSAGKGLATDIIGREERTMQRDVDELLSQFDYLNRVQKKQDVTEGVNVGQNLNTQFLNQGTAAAEAFNAAERGNTERTVGQATARNQRADQMQDRTFQALAALIGGPAAGALFGGVGAATAGGGIALGSRPGVGDISTFGQNNIPTGFGGRPSGASLQNLGLPGGGGLGQAFNQALTGFSRSPVKAQILQSDEIDDFLRVYRALKGGQ